MLKFMRKHTKSWIIWIFFGMIIVSFVLYFGYGGLTSDKENIIAQIGPHKVGPREYQETYDNVLKFSRMLYKDNLNEKMMNDLKKNVKEEITNKYLLLIKADELGLTVSDSEFVEFLNSVPAFKIDGKFNKEQYLMALTRNSATPEEFEKSWKQATLAQKVAGIIEDTGTFFNESDVWAGYVREKGKVNIAYAEFDPSAFKDKVSISEKELLDLYEKEKDAYKAENTYRLKELVIDTTGTLRDDAIYMDLLKAKDMEAYGREKGLTVIDLGSIKEGELSKKFKGLKIDEWLRSLKKGDISLPVREEGKSYIFQLVDMEEGKKLDKTLALAKIKERLVNEKSGAMAKLAAENAISRKTFNAKHETGFIARNAQSISGIGEIPQEYKGVFSLSKTNTLYDKPLEISGKYYVFSYKDEKLPDRDGWAKDKESYTKYFVAKNRNEFYKSFLAEMKKTVKVDWKEL